MNDLSVNPSASMTLWLPLQQREVVLEGIVEPLTQTENMQYWDALSRERQLRFMAYSVSTGKPIEPQKIRLICFLFSLIIYNN